MTSGVPPTGSAFSATTSDATGGANDSKFDAILAKMDASALKRAERDEKTTEHKDVNGSLKTAANQSAS